MIEFEEHPSKVGAWRNGQFVVLSDAAAENCTIWFGAERDTAGDVRWECLLGRRLDGETARVCAVPFWLYDLNLGDEVRTIYSAEGALVAAEKVSESGNYTFRASLAVEDGDDVGWRDLMKELEPFECWFDVRTPRFVAISTPVSHASGVAEYLAARERRGELQFDTGQRARRS